ncbi:MAG: hypothetical protein HONBIEJF_01063 [Fimbriimonadaceae bacterium]|nr:hypothetical protein [Fimbriimonadaceae bacterium]
MERGPVSFGSMAPARFAAIAAFLTILVNPARSQALELSEYGLGISFGAYFPQSREVRDALGGTWISYGVSPMRREHPSGWKFDIGFDYIGRSKNGNRVSVLGVGFGVRKVFGTANEFRPYVAAHIGPAYQDYAIFRGAQRVADRRFGLMGNLEVGVIISDRLKIRARYVPISKSDGFDFSGFSIGVSYQVFRF